MPKRKKSSHKPPPIPSRVPGPGVLDLRILAGVAIVVLAGLFAYFPCLNGEFVLDEDLLITENRLILASDGLWQIWFSSEAQDYWPVSNTALWIEWRLWGMDPTGYHVVNLILHIVSALLIWLILRKLFIPGAFLAALIFAVHPVNVESVAWVAQLKGVLALLFFLLSILCYLKFEIPSFAAHRPLSQPADAGRSPIVHRILFFCLSLLAFVLAGLSKGSVVVLPLIFLGIIWWHRKVTIWDLVRISPFLLASVIFILVNMWFQTHGLGKELRDVSFLQRLLGAGGVIWFYIYKALWPLNLLFIYPQWRIEGGNLLWWLPLLAALAITAILWLYRRTWSRPFLFAWGFFCVSLIPVLGFVDVGFMQYSLVADHYQHIAIIGVIALAAAGWGVWHQRAQRSSRWTAPAVAILAAGALTFLTWRQSGLYRETMTLYQVTLEKNPECWLIHNNLGIALGKMNRLQEAIEHFKEALHIKADYPEAFNNLGIALSKLGRHREAIEHYRRAIQLKENYPKAHNNLGVSLKEVGQIQEAINNYVQALRLNPTYPDAYLNLGNILEEKGQIQAAVEHYRKAIKYRPDFYEAHNYLGIALGKVGRPQEAIEHFQQALCIKPDFAEACANLAMAYAVTGQSAQAKAAAQRAMDIARAKGNAVMVRQLENWWNTHGAGQSTAPTAPPSAKPASPDH